MGPEDGKWRGQPPKINDSRGMNDKVSSNLEWEVVASSWEASISSRPGTFVLIAHGCHHP